GFPDFQSARKEIEAAVVTDPLLLELLFGAGPPDRFSSLPHEQRRLLVQCLRATVVSALSAPLLRGGGDAAFSVSGSPPPDLFAGARRAVVVGFGGYMD